MTLPELLKQLLNEDWENYAHGRTGALVFHSYIEQIEELCKKKMEGDVMSAFIKFLEEQK